MHIGDTLKLFTFEVSSSGDRATFGALTESEARAKAALYYPHVGAVFAQTPRCICVHKSANPALRQAGWLICDRRQCAGRIG